jgi:hypothetical protein
MRTMVRRPPTINGTVATVGNAAAVEAMPGPRCSGSRSSTPWRPRTASGWSTATKPGNILEAGPGGWKVGDFGIARSLESTDPALTATGLVIGTPAYLAPERLAGGPATLASDLYAAGAVLYEALAHRRVLPAGAPLAAWSAVPPPRRGPPRPPPGPGGPDHPAHGPRSGPPVLLGGGDGRGPAGAPAARGRSGPGGHLPAPDDPPGSCGAGPLCSHGGAEPGGWARGTGRGGGGIPSRRRSGLPGVAALAVVVVVGLMALIGSSPGSGSSGRGSSSTVTTGTSVTTKAPAPTATSTSTTTSPSTTTHTTVPPAPAGQGPGPGHGKGHKGH